LNYEDALCVYSPKEIGAIRQFIDGLIGECNPLPPMDRPHLIVEQVAQLLAPEL
jgi:hypothetical protein